MLYISLKELTTYSIMFLFFYNISIILFMNSLWTTIPTTAGKTLSLFKKMYEPVKKYTILIILLSMAGVPPFIGFLLKINLIAINSMYSIYILYIFFLFSFASLYFYIQNIRFLIIPSFASNFKRSFNDKKPTIMTIKITVLVLFYLTFGILFLDDLVIYFYWLIS